MASNFAALLCLSLALGVVAQECGEGFQVRKIEGSPDYICARTPANQQISDQDYILKQLDDLEAAAAGSPAGSVNPSTPTLVTLDELLDTLPTTSPTTSPLTSSPLATDVVEQNGSANGDAVEIQRQEIDDGCTSAVVEREAGGYLKLVCNENYAVVKLRLSEGLPEARCCEIPE